MTNQPTDPIDEPSPERRVDPGRDLPAGESGEGGPSSAGGHGMNLGAHAPPVPVRRQRGARGVTAPPIPLASPSENTGEETAAADVAPAGAGEAVASAAGVAEQPATVEPAADAMPASPAAVGSEAEDVPDEPEAPPRSRVVLLAALAAVLAFAGYYFLMPGFDEAQSEEGTATAGEPGAEATTGTEAEEPPPIDPSKLAAGREDMFLNSIDSLAQPTVSSLAQQGGNAPAAKAKGKAPRGVQVQPAAPAVVIEGDLSAASPEFVAWAKGVKIGGVRLGSAPRVVIGSAIVAPGAKVDAASGAVFVGIDEAKRLLRFREPGGAELGVRY